jgi:hypothetical protein
MKKPTAAQRRRWSKLVELGCMARRGDVPCGSPAEIHHCGTGAGGRKDHDKVIPLCPYHHRGAEGIHTLSRNVWQGIYGTENHLLELVREI